MVKRRQTRRLRLLATVGGIGLAGCALSPIPDLPIDGGGGIGGSSSGAGGAFGTGGAPIGGAPELGGAPPIGGVPEPSTESEKTPSLGGQSGRAGD